MKNAKRRKGRGKNKDKQEKKSVKMCLLVFVYRTAFQWLEISAGQHCIIYPCTVCVLSIWSLKYFTQKI
jgi:hypothetical protein